LLLFLGEVLILFLSCPIYIVYGGKYNSSLTCTHFVSSGGALGYNDQVVTYREYANSYYRDFFDHTRARRSDGAPGADDGLIMSRPVDCLIDGVSKVSIGCAFCLIYVFNTFCAVSLCLV